MKGCRMFILAPFILGGVGRKVYLSLHLGEGMSHKICIWGLEAFGRKRKKKRKRKDIHIL